MYVYAAGRSFGESRDAAGLKLRWEIWREAGSFDLLSGVELGGGGSGRDLLAQRMFKR